METTDSRIREKGMETKEGMEGGTIGQGAKE